MCHKEEEQRETDAHQGGWTCTKEREYAKERRQDVTFSCTQEDRCKEEHALMRTRVA